MSIKFKINQKAFSNILLLAVITAIILIGAGIGGYFVFVKNVENKQLNTIAMPASTSTDTINRIGANSTLRQSSGQGTVDTSEWKIYRNEKYWFEVKYPAEWNTKECYPSSVRLGMPDELKLPCDYEGGEGAIPPSRPVPVRIDIGVNSTTSSVEWDIKNAKVNLVDVSQSEMKVGGYLATVIRGRYSLDGLKFLDSTTTILPLNGYTYTLSYREFNERGYSAIFDQILSTFRFLDAQVQKHMRLFGLSESHDHP